MSTSGRTSAPSTRVAIELQNLRNELLELREDKAVVDRRLAKAKGDLKDLQGRIAEQEPGKSHIAAQVDLREANSTIKEPRTKHSLLQAKLLAVQEEFGNFKTRHRKQGKQLKMVVDERDELLAKLKRHEGFESLISRIQDHLTGDKGKGPDVSAPEVVPA